MIWTNQCHFKELSFLSFTTPDLTSDFHSSGFLSKIPRVRIRPHWALQWTSHVTWINQCHFLETPSFSTPSLLPSSSSAPEDLQISPAISETHTADTTALRKWHELVTWPGSEYLQWHNRNETSFSHQTIVILQWFVCSPCANRAANTLYFLCLCFIWILTQPTYICLHHGFLFQNKTISPNLSC